MTYVVTKEEEGQDVIVVAAGADIPAVIKELQAIQAEAESSENGTNQEQTGSGTQGQSA